MKLATETFGNVVVAHTPEELSEEQGKQLELFLTSLERPNVVVDLDGTESLESGGLEALLDAQDTLREQGGDLRISVTNVNNRKILEMTRLDQLIDTFETMLEAVKSFQ